MAEKKYIECEALIDTMQAALDALPKGAFNPNKIGFAAAIEGVKNFPAADVRPVVRGHKVTHNRPIAGYWASGKLDGGWDGMEGRIWVEPIMDNPVDYCSECGKRLDDTFQNFCPNCGADMREGS